MYEAVTGRVPFDAGTFNQLMFKIVLAEVPAPQSVVPELDPAFASIISKTMARDLSHRFQSTAEVIRALDEWLQSGCSVAVPSSGQSTAAGHLPAGARGSVASLSEASSPGQRTAGSWETSQTARAPLVIPAKSAAPLAALLAIGTLVLVGGALAAYSWHEKSLTAASSATSPVSVAPVATQTSGVPSASVPPVARAAEPVASPVTSAPSAAGAAPATHVPTGHAALPRASVPNAAPAKPIAARGTGKARRSAPAGKAERARFRLLSRARNFRYARGHELFASRV